MNDPLQFLSKTFPFLTEADVMAVLERSTMHTLQPGDVYVRAGMLSYKGAIVLQGLLRNYHTLDSGTERTVLFTTEGGFIAAYASVLQGQRATESIMAVEATTLVEVDVKQLRLDMETDHKLMRAYAKVLEQMLVNAIARIDEFVLLTPEQRYQQFLTDYPGLEQRVPQKYLASYLGITPISLSRMRHRMVKRKLT